MIKRIALLVIVGMMSSLAWASLTDGLVGYWPFDGDIKDASGHGCDLSGSASWAEDRNGNTSSAAYFNGGSSLVIPKSLYVENNITVSLWCKPYGTISTGVRESISETDGATMVGSEYVLYPSHGGFSTTGKAGVGLVVGQNGVIVMEHADEYCPCPLVWPGNIGNDWAMVTISISENGAPRLYINGDYVKDGMASSKNKFIGSSDWSLADAYPGNEEYRDYYFGAVIGNGATVSYSHCPYHGLMDDFRIFNRSLLASEIKALYLNDVGRIAYSVVYDHNGGVGEMEDDVFEEGKKQKLPKNTYAKDGYVFQGWAESKANADNGIVKFRDEAEIVVDHDMTLYAVWANSVLTLVAESADWSRGSITLCCTDVDTSGAAHAYTLQYYDEGAAEWKNVTSVQSASVGVSLTDTGFSSRLGGIPPVKYRVKDENGRVTEECVTRNRYLISVGYSKFLTKNKAKRGHYNDASQFRNLCVERGDFPPENAHFKGNATTEEIRNEMAYFAANTMPGDLFVFYIATHGGDFREKVFSTPGVAAEAHLATYDSTYRVSELLGDVRKFAPGVAVINIIMACHSFSQSGGVEVRETINNWLADCGFAQCLGNVAWITSCDAQQSSYTYKKEDNSRFGQAFIVNGFGHGCADARLFGTKYAGVEPDGLITVGELGRYAKEFFRGHSDDMPSSVQFNENEGLLDRIVIGRRTATPTWSRPAVPANVIASDGYFDTYVNVSWDGTSPATYYRVFRYPLSSPDEWKWIGISDGTTFRDETATLKCEYGYRVEAVNPIGVSDLSYVAVGSRGTSRLIEYLKVRFGVASASSDEYDAMEKTVAANGCRTVGECYALGIDPEDPNDDLKITDFKMEDGRPVITLNHTVDGSGNSFLPRAKTLGKSSLTGQEEWREVPEEGDPDMRFFKVAVEMP